MIKIAILGSGLSGMIAALGLASYGIQSSIIAGSKCFGGIRTISITHKSATILEKYGVWSKILPYASKVQDIYVIDNKSPDMIHLNNMEAGLGHMVAEGDLFEIIRDYAESNKLISFIAHDYKDVVAVDNFCDIILDDDLQIQGIDLVLACDGKWSQVRDKYFKNIAHYDYKDTALVFNVKHQKKHQGTAVEHFINSGVFALLPRIDPYESGVVWSVPRKVAHAVYQSLQDSANASEVIMSMAGDFLGDMQLISDVKMFDLTGHISTQYYYKQIVLVGDCAHCMHPLAGQGLNQGIGDVGYLCELIKGQLDIGIAPSIALNRYQLHRSLDNAKMMCAIGVLHKIFKEENFVFKGLRRLGFGLIERSAIVKNAIISYGI